MGSIILLGQISSNTLHSRHIRFAILKRGITIQFKQEMCLYLHVIYFSSATCTERFQLYIQTTTIHMIVTGHQ